MKKAFSFPAPRRRNKVVAAFVLLAVFFLAGCDGTKSKMESLSWMLGSWQGVTAEGMRFHEQWEKTASGAFVGKGAALGPDGDTLFKEVLKVEELSGTPYYIATVPENPGPVHFKLISSKDNSAHFENKEHDFPQEIIYTLEKDGVLTVSLRGLREGRPAQEELTFQKAN